MAETLDWRRGEAGDLILAGARVVDPASGLDEARDVVIRAGRIAELASTGSASLDGAERIDAEGLLAMPAFFDPHVHLRTPGREDEEDPETGARAAAAGGYCGILAMANTDPVVDTAADVVALRERAAAEACVPTGFLATATRGMAGEELTEALELRDAGAIGISDDGLPIASSRVMRRVLAYQGLHGLQLALHEQDPELSAGGSMHEGEVSAELGIGGWPSVAESIMIARDCELAAYESARIHVQHLSAASSVEAVEAAKARGVRITCEATPHHLVLTDEALRSLDADFKMNPPLRTEFDRQALIAGLRSGAIDCVATDHAPHAADEKAEPIESAPFGVTGLETAFAVLHTELVLPGVLPLDLLVERMSAGARAFDFAQPRIEPGAPADVVLFDPAVEWEVGADGWESRSRNSCFKGRALTGRVQLTVAGGRVAFRRRSFALGVAS
ncbi:dihydroorotase [Thermoleophilia bacterium SCSIO 60948]|nr:dihydroorotase [Thermoleophilia bacterium SCSIO 60948]